MPGFFGRVGPALLSALLAVSIVQGEGPRGPSLAGDTDQAIQQLQEHLRTERDDAEAINALGTAFASQGRTAEALACFLTARRIRPDWPHVAGNLAWILATADQAGLGDASEALQLAQVAAAADTPHPWRFQDTLAAALAACGKFPEAMQAAGRAVQGARDAGEDERAREYQARLELYRTGKPFRQPHRLSPAAGRLRPLTVDEIERALDPNGEDFQLKLDAMDRLAWVLATCERSDVRDGALAIRLARLARRRMPDPDPHRLRVLAAAQAAAGDFAAALETARRAATIAQNGFEPKLAARLVADVELYATGRCPVTPAEMPIGCDWTLPPGEARKVALAAMLVAQRHLESTEKHRGVAMLQLAVVVDPTFVPPRLSLVSLLLERGRIDEAEQQLRLAMAFQPWNAEALALLGDCRVASGRATEALGLFDVAHRLNPDLRLAANNLAWMLATHESPRLRNPAEALQIVRRACRSAEGVQLARTLDTLGVVYAANGRFQEAAMAARQSLKIADEHRPDTAWREAVELRLKVFEAGLCFRTDWLAHLELAAIRLREGDTRQAARHHLEALRFIPPDVHTVQDADTAADDGSPVMIPGRRAGG